MSSRLSHRLAVTTLALALLLALAAPPAQAAQSAGALDTLTAKVHTWLSALWPWGGASADSALLTDPNGRAHAGALAVHSPAGPHGSLKAHHGVRGRNLRPGCDNGLVVDPNGGCVRP